MDTPTAKKLAYGCATFLYLSRQILLTFIRLLCRREVIAKAMTPNIKVAAVRAEVAALEAKLSKESRVLWPVNG